MKKRPIPIIDVVGLLILLFIAGLSHGEVFGGFVGLRAVFGGIIAGAIVAIISARYRLSAAATLVFALLAYLLVGPGAALSDLSYFGVLPSIEALQTLVVQSLYSWRDLLTLSPPAQFFIGPSVMPYMAGFICSLIALTLSLRPLWGTKEGVGFFSDGAQRRMHPPATALALIPVFILLIVGIAWGIHSARYSGIIGCAVAVGSVIWMAWREYGRRRLKGTVMSAKPVGHVFAGTLILALCVALVGGLFHVTSIGASRDVLRDHVVPPLDLHDYPTPLSDFRHIIKDQEKQTLFTVKGLPKGTRLRLGAMDVYNGEVYDISEDSQISGGFKNIGSRVEAHSAPPNSVRATLDITVHNYRRPWIAGAGNLHSITCPKRYQDSLFYDSDLETMLTTTTFTPGTRYRVDVDLPREWKEEQLSGQQFSTAPMPRNDNVPQVINDLLPQVIGTNDEPVAKVRAIERYFRDNGYFSNGKDGMSDAGHRAERIKRLVGSDVMIGDDEQYAVAMALMAREAGIPARVVMGFYPKNNTGATWKVTGNDVHAWVEVRFQTAGWVAFDPTPPRDKVPQTTIPQPKKTPNPLVLQPPQPPPTPAELNVDPLDDSGEKDSVIWWLLSVLWQIVKIGLWIVLIALPFIIIMAIKARRLKKRRHAPSDVLRMQGVWDEVVDRAWDCGIDVPVSMTRWQQAAVMTHDMNPDIPQRSYTPDDRGGRSPKIPPPQGAVGDGMFMLATQVDAATFGNYACDDQSIEKAWEYADKLEDEMRRPLPLWRRVASRIWLTSLIRRAKQQGLGRHKRRKEGKNESTDH